MMGTPIPDLETGQQEWAAWLATGKALESATGKTWNDERWFQFHAAVVLWGEYLAALRISQTSEVRAKAFREATDRMERMSR